MVTILAAFQGTNGPEERVARCWARVRGGGDEVPACIVDAAAAVAPTVLAPSWSGLDEAERRRFNHALAAAMRRDLLGLGEGSLELLSKETDGRQLKLRYRLGSRELDVVFSSGRLLDIYWEDTSVKRHYRRVCEPLLKGYSFAYLVGELEGRGVVVLEDFDAQPVGELPRGWKWRGFGQEDEKPYRVVEQAGNRFLRAEDRGENVMLYKEVRWDTRKYPYISWRWRIRAVPDGADARREDMADSAAGLYLTYRRKLGLVPEAVKFVWSGHLSAGMAFRRPGVGMPWTVVAGSGSAGGEWHRYVYHVSDVYTETFGGSPGERPLGVGLLSDANNTNSYAAADYDDIVALQQATAPNQVQEILDLR